MFKSRKPESARQKAVEFIQQANQFEKSQIEAVKRNNRLAWRVAAVSLSLAFLSVVAVMLLTPLKTVTPYVIRVDNNTGATDIVTVMKHSETSYGEVVDRYWLSQYVQMRESYDWWTVQSTYDASMLLSSPTLQNEIAVFFESDAAPYKVFQDRYRVDIKILSISWIGQTAQVRFEKQVKPLTQGQKTPPPQRYIATIGYRYVNTAQAEKDRLVNPLGLQVLSYRVDPEG